MIDNRRRQLVSRQEEEPISAAGRKGPKLPVNDGCSHANVKFSIVEANCKSMTKIIRRQLRSLESVCRTRCALCMTAFGSLGVCQEISREDGVFIRSSGHFATSTNWWGNDSNRWQGRGALSEDQCEFLPVWRFESIAARQTRSINGSQEESSHVSTLARHRI